MNPVCKHFVNPVLALRIVGLGLLALCLGQYAGVSHAKDKAHDKADIDQILSAPPAYTAGSIAPGNATGGIISELYVAAPPNYYFQVEKMPGSFVNCGEGFESHTSDQNGRQTTALSCGVTITETLVIPAAAQSARLIVHY